MQETVHVGCNSESVCTMLRSLDQFTYDHMVEQLSSSSEIPVHVHTKWSNVSRLLHPCHDCDLCCEKVVDCRLVCESFVKLF